MMKFKKLIIAVISVCAVGILPLAAYDKKTVTFNDANGTPVTLEIPADVYDLVQENHAKIQVALIENKVSADDLRKAQTAILEGYDSFVKDSNIENPYTTVKDGIEDIGDLLANVMPNSQLTQNVWAHSIIHYNRPEKHKIAGGGLNVGATGFSLEPLLDITDALGIDDIPISYLALPTLAVDARVCGFSLPFDVGIAFSTFNTSMISQLKEAIDPSSFNYMSIGGDFRWAVLNNREKHVTVSVGGGAYYTQMGAKIAPDEATIEASLKTFTAFVGTQASVKFHALVPFAGFRLFGSTTKLNLDVKDINWDQILDGSDGDGIMNAAKWGILPTSLSESYSSSFFSHIRPQIYGGLGLDLALLSLTTSLSFDPIGSCLSGAFSIRLVF